MKKNTKVKYQNTICKVIGVYQDILELKVDSTHKCFARKEDCVKLVKKNMKVIPKYKRILYIEITKDGGLGHITYSKEHMKDILDSNNKVFEFQEVKEIKL